MKTHRLTATALGCLLIVGTTSGIASGQSSVTVMSTVRDFQQSHPDFGLSGFAFQNAGNVALAPDASGDPTFTGGGFEVAMQWYERNGNEIAPHLYNLGAEGQVNLVNPPSISNNPTIDSYSPGFGPYDPVTNAGPMPNIVSGAAMPVVPPEPALPYTKDIMLSGNATTLMTASVHCETFVLQTNHEMIVQGDLTIIADAKFNVENYSEIVIPDGSSLTVYVKGDAVIQNNVSVNTNSADHTRLVIYNISPDKPMVVENKTHIYASLISPTAPLIIKNTGDFYGTVTARDLDISNSAGLHIAATGGGNCYALADTAGSAGAGATGSITSAATFSQWFKTVPSINADARIPITFVDDGTGVLEFSEADFAPINGKLYGNEGDSENRNFTMEFDAQFTNSACAGGFFEFRGDGDVWVYIDNQLVIDLAGPQSGGHQYIDIDRLGLTDGAAHKLRFRYAQREPGAAPFQIRTNLPLRSDLDIQRPSMSFYD